MPRPTESAARPRRRKTAAHGPIAAPSFSLRCGYLKAYSRPGTEVTTGECSRHLLGLSRRWACGPTRSAMRRLTAVQPKINLNGCFSIRRTRTPCPLPTHDRCNGDGHLPRLAAARGLILLGLFNVCRHAVVDHPCVIAVTTDVDKPKPKRRTSVCGDQVSYLEVV
jgi:hypothetical protein